VREIYGELYVLSDRGLLIVKMKNHIENDHSQKREETFK
jgi:hypothetical protein